MYFRTGAYNTENLFRVIEKISTPKIVGNKENAYAKVMRVKKYLSKLMSKGMSFSALKVGGDLVMSGSRSPAKTEIELET